MTEAIVGINQDGVVRAMFCIDTPGDEREAADTAARWLREGRTVKRCSDTHAAEVFGEQWREPGKAHAPVDTQALLAGTCPACGRDNSEYGNVCTSDDCPDYRSSAGTEGSGPSPERLATLFDGTRFGGEERTDTGRRGLMVDCVLKHAAGYSAGHTITGICTQAGLLGNAGNPTKAGLRWAFRQLYSSGATILGRLEPKEDR